MSCILDSCSQAQGSRHVREKGKEYWGHLNIEKRYERRFVVKQDLALILPVLLFCSILLDESLVDLLLGFVTWMKQCLPSSSLHRSEVMLIVFSVLANPSSLNN